MSIKLAVWEVGKADPDRYDRANDLSSFVEILKNLKAGDQATLFSNSDRNEVNFGEILTFVVDPQPKSLYQALYEELSSQVGSLLTLEQIAKIDEKLTELTKEYDRK